jgi:hypothetical protein
MRPPIGSPVLVVTVVGRSRRWRPARLPAPWAERCHGRRQRRGGSLARIGCGRTAGIELPNLIGQFST